MLIKYYNFVLGDGGNTCYDGNREFAKRPGNKQERFYPDEYLIANILRIFSAHNQPQLGASNRKVTILTEPWNGGNPPSKYQRNGGANISAGINDLILAKIDELQQQESDKEHLILVPFLYGYHHPGIAILIKPDGSKKAIFVDPFGGDGYYHYTGKIGEKLHNERGFDFSIIKTQQQQRGVDGTSCGPILTASMMEFIEEFITTGDITGQTFKSPRPNLATERMMQIVINNEVLDFSDLKNSRELLVNELMLADEKLWNSYMTERNASLEVRQIIIARIKQQKLDIMKLPADWQDSEDLRKIVASICQLQTALIKAVDDKVSVQEIEAVISEFPLLLNNFIENIIALHPLTAASNVQPDIPSQAINDYPVMEKLHDAALEHPHMSKLLVFSIAGICITGVAASLLLAAPIVITVAIGVAGVAGIASTLVIINKKIVAHEATVEKYLNAATNGVNQTRSEQLYVNAQVLAIRDHRPSVAETLEDERKRIYLSFG